MKSAIIFSFLLLCLTTVSQAQNLNKAYAAMEEGDWEVALGMLEPIIKKNAKNNEAKFLAAICHTERYRLEQAIGLFNESTAFAQDSPYFWVKFAKAYLLNEQIDEAEQTIKKVRMQDLDDFLRPDYLLVSSNIQNAKKYLPNPRDIIIKNLGPNINTEGNEYSQVVTGDQRGIFFTARRKGTAKVADDGEAYEQVLTADMNDIDEWDKDNPLEGFASTTANEAPIQLFNNDSTLITFYDEDLFISQKRKDGTWSKRDALPINSKRWDSHAFIYNNGNSMIYASDINHEVENLDLYIMHKDDKGKWGKPAPIAELNTPLNDDAPFVAEDGTFYFSSRGHDSMGGYDIFSTKYDSASGKFNAPVNMGAPINLPNDDTFFTMYGGFAYLSSSRPEGYGQVDIYRIIMFNQSQIQGKFLECDGVTPVANATITVEGEDGPMSTTTDEYGVYKMVMPIERSFDLRAVLNGETIYEKKHTIRVLFRDQFDVDQNFYVGCEKNDETIYVKMINGFDLDPINLPVDPPSIEGIKPKVTEEVVAEAAPPVEEPKEIIAPVAVDKKIKLPNVFFDFDKHNIKSDFFKRLNEAAELLIENRELRVMVAGHTDAYGTNPYNVALGIRRYTEVYNYLISKGVDPSQLEVKTFSEDIPISTNRTIEGRAFNRRVELSFIEN
ncbi:OmpA family protein [uncultured Roseivirga sp.]|uniref:OmpA family protein n=1 Tax=uncultured Roseivirga sp. TaxID=543088 RepID=UPI0030DC58CA|tara:strand:+ start:277429 stop:279432 length:2004 start_codon:yes stop_codon:yes gene_type:complete